MLAAAPTSLGTETLYRVKPHETVDVTGGGGSIQKVPWNIPANGNIRFGGLGALTDDDKNKIAGQIKTAIDGGGGTDIVQSILSTVADANDRNDIAAKAIALGASAGIVQQALSAIQARDSFVKNFKVSKPAAIFWSIASTASMALGAYHGYKRNDSLGWALWWGAMGAFFPIITPTIAFAQGFGQPKHRAAFGRRRRKHNAPKRFRRRV